MQHQRVVEMTYFQAHARTYTVMPQLIERTEYNQCYCTKEGGANY